MEEVWRQGDKESRSGDKETRSQGLQTRRQGVKVWRQGDKVNGGGHSGEVREVCRVEAVCRPDTHTFSSQTIGMLYLVAHF